MIVGIPHAQIEQWWPLIEPLVAKALKYADGKYAPENVLEGLKARQYQLWMANVLDAICVTQIINYPQKRVCIVFLAAGKNMHRWVNEMDETISAWARERGCKSIEMHGRPGWERVLMHNKKLHISLGREL